MGTYSKYYTVDKFKLTGKLEAIKFGISQSETGKYQYFNSLTFVGANIDIGRAVKFEEIPIGEGEKLVAVEMDIALNRPRKFRFLFC